MRPFGGFSSDKPKYRQIADDLRAALGAGIYRPGDRLPGENALMTHYRVARMTVRQALGVLHAEGLTLPRKGAGVFVRAVPGASGTGVARTADKSIKKAPRRGKKKAPGQGLSGESG